MSTIAKTHALDGTWVGLSKLRFAVQRLKTRKCGDELGLKTEVFKNAFDEFSSMLLGSNNNV